MLLLNFVFVGPFQAELTHYHVLPCLQSFLFPFQFPFKYSFVSLLFLSVLPLSCLSCCSPLPSPSFPFLSLITPVHTLISFLLYCLFSPISPRSPPLYRALRWGPSWVSTSPASRIFWGSSCFCALPGSSVLPASWSLWLLSACAALV